MSYCKPGTSGMSKLVYCNYKTTLKTLNNEKNAFCFNDTFNP